MSCYKGVFVCFAFVLVCLAMTIYPAFSIVTYHNESYHKKACLYGLPLRLKKEGSATKTLKS